jgi:hypothetical protein
MVDPDSSGIKLFHPTTLELRGGYANRHGNTTTIKLAKLLDSMPGYGSSHNTPSALSYSKF